MKRNFVELQNFLSTRFPELKGRIRGENYPPPAYAQMLVSVVGSLQMGAIVMLLFGNKVFEAIGMPEPAFLNQMRENKMMTFMGIFMANSMANSLTSTGAFEVFLDGHLIFSKLESGALPNGRIMMHLLRDSGLTLVQPPHTPPHVS